MTFRSSRVEWIGLTLCFAASVAFGMITTSRGGRGQRAYLNPPPEMLEYFTFGFSETMADSLWLRWIQDGEVCQKFGPVTAPTSTSLADPAADEFFNPRHRECDNSWSYKMLEGVTKLAPRFRMPYFAGTMMLAVLVEDYAGTTRLFERALEVFPNDWEILYRAGYHYLFDLKDLARAGDLLKRAADHGAPYWVRFLAAKLYSRSGQAALGIATLENYLKTLDDDQQREQVIKRIKDIQKGLASAKPDGP